MRIGIKLIIGFLVVAALVGVVGYIGYNSLKFADEKIHVVAIEHMVPLSESLHVMMMQLHISETAIHAIMLGEEHGKIDLQKSTIKFDEEMEKAAAAAAGESEMVTKEHIEKHKQEFDLIKTQHLHLHEDFEEIITLIEQGNLEQAQKIYDEHTHDEVEELIMYIHEVQADVQEELDTAIDDVEKSIHTALPTIIMTVILSIIMALGLGLFISRSISKPITKLKDGNLDVKAEVKSKDEIGELAGAFNQMAKDLKESRKKFEEAEKEKSAAAAAAAASKEGRFEELEKFNKLSVGRELKMIELKKRIKELEGRLK